MRDQPKMAGHVKGTPATTPSAGPPKSAVSGNGDLFIYSFLVTSGGLRAHETGNGGGIFFFTTRRPHLSSCCQCHGRQGNRAAILQNIRKVEITKIVMMSHSHLERTVANSDKLFVYNETSTGASRIHSGVTC